MRIDEALALQDPDFNGFCHRLRPRSEQVAFVALGSFLLVCIWSYRAWVTWTRGSSETRQAPAPRRFGRR